MRRPEEPGAAFFDLDRTLMEGSSAFQFGRAAYRAGLVNRRVLLRDAYENVLFRLRGSTDAGTDALRARIGELLRGVRVRDLQRLAPDVLAGVLPRLYPKMLELAYHHQDAGRPIVICTAASQEMAELLAVVLTFDGAVGSVSEIVDGEYTGRPGGPFTYREGKAEAMRAAGGARGHRPRRARGRTRTPSPTCRCCARSGIPSRSTPTARSRAWRARRAGRSCASSASTGACASRARWSGAAALGRRRLAGRAPGGGVSELTAEQEEIRSLARRFADEKIAPHAADVGPRTTRFPPTLFAELGELGLMGVCVPGRARRRGRRLPRLHARARGALARRRRRRRDGRRAHERVHAAAARPRLAVRAGARRRARRSGRSR